MSDPTAPALPQPEAPEQVPTVAQRRPRTARLNPLAVAALILGIMLSPLAALFGHLAVGQITRSRGRERGLALAWVAVGLGYLWLVTALIATAGVVIALSGGGLGGGLLGGILGP